MSRKTRKEKIIATLRRDLKKKTLSVTQPNNLKQAEKHKARPTTAEPMEQISYAYVGHDLRKTAILSIIAIGLELSLYYYLK